MFDLYCYICSVLVILTFADNMSGSGLDENSDRVSYTRDSAMEEVSGASASSVLNSDANMVAVSTGEVLANDVCRRGVKRSYPCESDSAGLGGSGGVRGEESFSDTGSDSGHSSVQRQRLSREGSVDSLQDNISGTCSDDEDIVRDTCPVNLLRDSKSICADLRNRGRKRFDFPMDVFCDNCNLLAISPDAVLTMDAFSKCYKTIATNDVSTLTQPSEG